MFNPELYKNLSLISWIFLYRYILLMKIKKLIKIFNNLIRPLSHFHFWSNEWKIWHRWMLSGFFLPHSTFPVRFCEFTLNCTQRENFTFYYDNGNLEIELKILILTNKFTLFYLHSYLWKIECIQFWNMNKVTINLQKKIQWNILMF